jgi:uncharacterized protein
LTDPRPTPGSPVDPLAFLQILAGLGEVKRNNVFGYTAFCCYGGFWMSVGIIKVVCLLATDVPPAVNEKAAQAMLFMLGGISFMFWTVTITMNITICLLFFFLTVTCILLSFGVQNENVDTVGGYFGMITSVNAFWLAYAVLVNEVLGKGTEIIPLGQLNKWKLFQRRAEHQPPVPAGFSTACHITDDSIDNSDVEEAQG